MNEHETLIADACVLKEGKRILTCSRALELAEEHDISPMEIGEICNLHGIKLRQCQLGCFK